MCQLLRWHKAKGSAVVWKYSHLNCLCACPCACAHRFTRHTHTCTNTCAWRVFHSKHSSYSRPTGKKKGIWSLLSKEKDGK